MTDWYSLLIPFLCAADEEREVRLHTDRRDRDE